MLQNENMSDLIKAAMLATTVAITPVQSVEPAEINVNELDEYSREILDSYNVISNKLTIQDAQDMAVKAIHQVGEEAINGDATESKAWDNVNFLYKSLANINYQVATAFLSAFNTSAKQLFSAQIRPVPPQLATESMKDLPIHSRISFFIILEY